MGSADPYKFLTTKDGFRTGWQHAEYDELLEKASAMMDFSESLKLYQQADRILINEVPILPFGYARINILIKPWVRRFPMSPECCWYWKEIVLEAH